MECQDCGSRKITWNLDAGYIITEYDKNGQQIDIDLHCDSLTSPQCAMCDSTNLK